VPLFRAFARGVSALLHPGRADADLADEVRHYLDEAAAAGQGAGNATALRETVRASGWEHAVETTVADVRYALRGLRRRPAFTLTAVATLALGIGATATVFSVLNPILVEPFPFPDANRLVTLDDRNSDGVPMPATLGTYAELVARTHSFQMLAAADPWRPSLTGITEPERLEGERVTAGYFGLFGALPVVGRDFTPADEQPGAPNVVILSEGLAERRFGGARAILNRPIELGGDLYLVVGVMPRVFANVLAPAAAVWSPVRERPTADFETRQWGHHYQLVGRLTPGSTVESAAREILAVGRAAVPDFPRPTWAGLTNGLLVRPLQEAVTGSARPALLAITLSVLLLLAIASVNVANLLLARGAERHAELAMRVALGAGRGRLLRQVLTESVTLALLGGALGLLLAEAGVHALVAASPPGLPRMDAIRLDPTVSLFALALTTLVGVLVGIAPALAARRGGGAAGLPRDSRRATARSRRTRGALVVAEVSLALVLLVSAGLLFRSVRLLVAVAPGFDPGHVITMQVVEAGHAFDSGPARVAFYDQALDAVRRVPGVASAAFTSLLPLSGEVDAYGYERESAPRPAGGDDGDALRSAVTPGYFATLRIPLIRGRLLDATDRSGAPEAVIINERFARRLFGDRDPVGQRVRFGPEQSGAHAWDEVVGVVGDVKHYSLAVGAPNEFYVVNGQWAWVDNVETLVVRSSGPAAALAPLLQRAIWSVNAHVPIQRVQTMDGFVAASAGNRRFALLAIETFALAALLLAAVGLYGVISGSVTERVREIGIRTALGASPGDVVRQVLRRALGLTAAGAAVGVLGALAATRLLASMLFGVTALDPLTYGAVIAVLGAVAILAAWAPARRAVGVDPTVALRAE